MDENRQIRFLIPPFFLYASLLWWFYIDPYLHCSISAVAGGTLKDIVPLIAAAGAATFPVGLSIGTLGVFVLTQIIRVRMAYRRWMKRPPQPRQIYEAWVSEDCFAGILLVTGAPDPPRDNARPNLLSAVATFDHELLQKGVHEWVRRRFNAFVVSYNSALAIIFSLLVVFARRLFYIFPFDRYCGLSESQWEQQAHWGERKYWWLIVNVALVALLLWGALKSWRETMDMIEFQSRRTNVDELKRRKQE